MQIDRIHFYVEDARKWRDGVWSMPSPSGQEHAEDADGLWRYSDVNQTRRGFKPPANS